MTYGDGLWLQRQRDARRLAEMKGVPCESGAECQHKDRPIAIALDGDGRVLYGSEHGLIYTPDGVRHRGCPDTTLAQRIADAQRQFARV